MTDNFLLLILKSKNLSIIRSANKITRKMTSIVIPKLELGSNVNN